MSFSGRMWPRYLLEVQMPVNQSLMKSLKAQHGAKKGEDIYYAMESEGKGPFKKGLATVKARGKKGGK